MKNVKKTLLSLIALATLAIPSMAYADGYHARSVTYGNYQAINGFLKIPSSYAGNEKPSIEAYPEMFFGMYNKENKGFDIGLAYGLNGKREWRLVFWSSPEAYANQWASSDHAVPKVKPNDELQVQATVLKKNNEYYAQADVYKNGSWIDGFEVPINADWAADFLANGGNFNRELNIAANSSFDIYTKSGAYFNNAQWGKTWLIKDINNSDSWTGWTTDISQNYEQGPDEGGSDLKGSKVFTTQTVKDGFIIDIVSMNFRK
ncbi:hypothetical protein ABER61_27955 [Brevibacillus formosus]|uniref:Uncharacterized protein n=1 Tax=Brevibacillus formosus TaxID=54913 RepID=A0A837KHR4_9BACL|nr:hypothetical protein [Brevibacillus formosus]KLH95859.1 hypothetical protein AA984_28510 [Brevibacillus formosus]MED1955138.1 hypothetical protein [Brevibacillus formosus]PSJ94992.1 hypothetical protein C7R91_16495 [Brevibacillus formosus]GED61429.1 hypothetical protein BFO01nite_55610 [Brevibacillus formosus]